MFETCVNIAWIWIHLSCCCPPRPSPSIPDHNIWQGMPWEHTEGLPTPRWWTESKFPGFPEMHHFRPANRPTHEVLHGQIFTPPFFALMGMIWPLAYLGTKELVKFWPKPAFLHPYHLSGREMAQIQPPTLTLDPKLTKFNAKVLHLCIETIGWPQMCSSGKGHELPFFGWAMADLTFNSCHSVRRATCLNSSRCSGSS